MISTTEKIISIIAPHHCISCGKQGLLLCSMCQQLQQARSSSCYRCNAKTNEFLTCSGCRSSSPLRRVYAFYDFEEINQLLVHKLKYERSKVAYLPIAQMITSKHLTHYDIICPIPTSAKHRRQRGYGHAEVIAKEVANLTGVYYRKLLVKTNSTRQVGSSRAKRFKQAENSYQSTLKAKGGSVLLVDDVLSTGATIEACAKILKLNGAKKVDALVFAKQNLK